MSNGTAPNDQSNPAAATPVYVAPMPGATSENITTATNTLVKTGPGTFLGISVNAGGSGSSAAVYDGIDATGVLIGTYSTATEVALDFPGGGRKFAAGLFVVTSGGTPANVTIAYA